MNYTHPYSYHTDDAFFLFCSLVDVELSAFSFVGGEVFDLFSIWGNSLSGELGTGGKGLLAGARFDPLFIFAAEAILEFEIDGEGTLFLQLIWPKDELLAVLEDTCLLELLG